MASFRSPGCHRKMGPEDKRGRSSRSPGEAVVSRRGQQRSLGGSPAARSRFPPPQLPASADAALPDASSLPFSGRSSPLQPLPTCRRCFLTAPLCSGIRRMTSVPVLLFQSHQSPVPNPSTLTHPNSFNNSARRMGPVLPRSIAPGTVNPRSQAQPSPAGPAVCGDRQQDEESPSGRRVVLGRVAPAGSREPPLGWESSL
ncbi:PREDICTED: NAC-alpha domain-containing protein 1-like [Cercocebus atys]|uniref:NAC-alpha domain-containing protein 1-like n=1 Tax=Cercocebus atys TaxID=9531 RepID=UPI0005F37CEB|nr:PREDICTED: NAC-alpha domain-containing protein 1-like [Cercocebus atys]